MNPVQSSASKDLISVLTRDVIESIADRPNESQASRMARATRAMEQIEEMQPGDGMEIMIAGQMVLMRNLAQDAIQDAHRETDPDRAYRHRQQALAISKVELSYLKEFQRHRARRLKAALEASPTETVATAAPVAAAAKPQPPSSPVPIVTARSAPPRQEPRPLAAAPIMPVQALPQSAPPMRPVVTPAMQGTQNGRAHGA